MDRGTCLPAGGTDADRGTNEMTPGTRVPGAHAQDGSTEDGSAQGGSTRRRLPATSQAGGTQAAWGRRSSPARRPRWTLRGLRVEYQRGWYSGMFRLRPLRSTTPGGMRGASG